MQYVDLGKTVEQHQRIREMQQAKQNDGRISYGIENTNGEKKPKNPRKKFIWIGVFGILIVLGFIFRGTLVSIFDPVSIISDLPSHNLKTTDGRTNILILGKDARLTGTETSVLTDTLLFASIGEIENNVAMISLPRDLWVKSNALGGTRFMKINSVYATFEDGATELVNVVEDVLGMPVHYYVVVDFSLFKNAIDILGGIEVDVENSFIDYQYPVEGQESSLCGRSSQEIEEMQNYAYHIVFPCRYETLEFEAGLQTMDGETTLKYVRSRKGNNNEGTDFARSKRQQNVIMSIKDKALTLTILMDVKKIKEFYELYSENIDTNISLIDVQGFYLLSQQISFDAVRSIVLDDRSGADEGGLLYHPTDSSLYGGQYVLIPKVGSYSQIHAYVQRYVFGDL